MVTFPMTFSDHKPRFQGHSIFSGFLCWPSIQVTRFVSDNWVSCGQWVEFVYHFNVLLCNKTWWLGDCANFLPSLL